MSHVARLSLHEWACLRTELYWIYDQPVVPPSRHSHSTRRHGFYAWYLRKGHLTFRHGDKTWHVKTGMWFFPPAGTSNHDFSDDAHLLSVQFLCQWPSGENFINNAEGLLIASKDYPELERRAVRLERLVRRHFPEKSMVKHHAKQTADYRTFLHFQTYFFNWLEAWMQIQSDHGRHWTRLSSGDDRPLLAARCLNEAPLDAPFPRAQLQRETKLSEVHLNRLFLQAFGMSPRKYWDKRKLEFARNCLDTSLMPVKEIAYRCGFRSDANFAVWFRRATGQRPSEYREQGGV